MADTEVFMHQSDKPETLDTAANYDATIHEAARDVEQPQETPESGAETPTDDVRHEGTPDTSEDATGDPEASEPDPADALSESERNAYDNFSHMAETAPTDQARKFWLAKALGILGELSNQ